MSGGGLPLMEMCLGEYNFETVPIYLINIILFSKTIEDHIQHLLGPIQVDVKAQQYPISGACCGSWRTSTRPGQGPRGTGVASSQDFPRAMLFPGAGGLLPVVHSQVRTDCSTTHPTAKRSIYTEIRGQQPNFQTRTAEIYALEEWALIQERHPELIQVQHFL